MNQAKVVCLKKQKSRSETELNSILITIECQQVEQVKRIKSQSLVPLIESPDNEESKNEYPCQTEQEQNQINVFQIQQVPSLISIYTSESNISLEDEFEIWDNNSDLRILKIVLEDQTPSIGQFLQLYKARFGAFPGQQQCIQNEEVIKTAINYASSSKQLFKKYFPSRKIIFDDDNDYSEPYKIENDHHFQTFNNFFQDKKPKTLIHF